MATREFDMDDIDDIQLKEELETNTGITGHLYHIDVESVNTDTQDSNPQMGSSRNLSQLKERKEVERLCLTDPVQRQRFFEEYCQHQREENLRSVALLQQETADDACRDTFFTQGHLFSKPNAYFSTYWVPLSAARRPNCRLNYELHPSPCSDIVTSVSRYPMDRSAPSRGYNVGIQENTWFHCGPLYNINGDCFSSVYFPSTEGNTYNDVTHPISGTNITVSTTPASLSVQDRENFELE